MASTSVEPSDVSSLAADTAGVLGKRMLVVDLGHSTLPPIRQIVPVKRLTWRDVADAQQETQAALILACGAKKGTLAELQDVLTELRELFPGWDLSITSTDGSLLVAIANPRCWELGEHATGNSLRFYSDRSALCLLRGA